MTPKAIKDINDYGYYILLLMGHQFIMEINPIRASITAPLFLKNCVDKLTINVDGNQGIFEHKDIRDIDSFMERWGRKDIDIRNNLFR